MEISVKTSTGSYDIILERGALNKVGQYLDLNRKVLIVTDSGVPFEYAEKVAENSASPFIAIIPQGEKSKCFDRYKELLEYLVKENFTRKDCVVAVGGGVVGDLAGFVASTYMRGIAFYNIPTTVLSQVDSSIGGKVAIDFSNLKNIVGAFYPPKRVIIDADVLKTLDGRQVSNGLAESVKMALTSDAELFELFENSNIQENMELIIEKSLRIKKSVVEQDEKESGLRKILNFGHTVAHGIEAVNYLQNWYHGECVAVGMLPMCSKAVKTRLIKVLNKLKLPTAIECDIDTMIEAMRHDKKMSADCITVIEVEEVGSFVMKDIPFDQLAQKIKETL